jgi:5S rRNA maturation endonuclease (ribonuclease M5)
MLQLPQLESFDWESRKIPSSVLDSYGVGIDQHGRVVSPHYSPSMELLALHSRTPGTRDFRTQGINAPIGLHTLGNNKDLIICEGHTDVYSTKVMFPNSDVIGVPGSNTVPQLVPYLSKLRGYRRITVMVDGDEAGARCSDALLEVLPRHKTYTVQLDEGTDVNDYLVNDRQDDIKRLYSLARGNGTSKFVTPEDCERYATSAMYDVVSTGITELDTLMGGGIGIAELTLLTGYTGTGKSALTQQIAVNIARTGIKVLYIAGEMTPKQNLDRMVRQWCGFTPLKEDLADAYKLVSEFVLITKLDDLSLTTVTDVIAEAVMDYGVRVVIVDVLSDVDNFLSTDMSHPAKIIKQLHKAALGSEKDNQPPCGLLCVAHTKGGDEGGLRSDSIRGGSVIRQEATCILGIEEREPGNMANTRRLVTLLKRPRNRDHGTTVVSIRYETHSQRYTSDIEGHTNGNHTKLPLKSRTAIPRTQPSPDISPAKQGVSLGTEADDQELLTVENGFDGGPVEVTQRPDTQLPAGLSGPSDTDHHRDKGCTTASGQDEIHTGDGTSPNRTIQDGSAVNTEHVPSTPSVTDGPTEPVSDIPRRLSLLHAMYEKNPELLRDHIDYKSKENNLIRSNLTALGYLTQ